MAGNINAATPAEVLAARDAVVKLEKELQLYAQVASPPARRTPPRPPV